MILSYNDFQITQNFNIKEFHCKSGERVPHHYVCNAVYLATQLQKLRFRLGNCTITINSAYRSVKHNQNIGGVPKSNHLYCLAADITTQKYTPQELYTKIKELVKGGQIPNGEIILYGTFVHYAPQFELKHTNLVEEWI